MAAAKEPVEIPIEDGDAPEPEVVEAEVVEPEEEAAEEAADAEGEDVEEVEGEAVEADAEEAEDDELAAAQAKATEMQDRYLRLQAEWDNYRKRTAAERDSERIRANEKLVTDLIPVIDDLERAVDHAKQTGEGGSLTEGVEAVLTKFLQILEKSKVTQVAAEGEPFDPMKHQAVGTQEDDSVPEETVVTVYQKGYQMGDRVLRPAMVVTSTGGPAREADAN